MSNGIDPLLYNGGRQAEFSRMNELSRQGQQYAREYTEKLEEGVSFQSALISSPRSEARKNLPSQGGLSISSDALSPNLSRADVRRHINGDAGRQKLYDAAQEFEAFFLEKMFKEMKKNVPKNELINGGFAEEVFDDLLTTERVRNISQQSEFGLAEKMYQQLSRL